MKKQTYNQRRSQIIMLGYLWRWCPIILILVPIILIKICEIIGVAQNALSLLFSFSFGFLFLSYGFCDIIGAILEFKHLLVSLQLANRLSPNPEKSWTKADKKMSIFCGIIISVIGIAMLLLYLFEILR